MTRSSLLKTPRSSLRTPPARAVSVAAMQRIDATAIDDYHIPRLLLMEHAGLAVARAARSLVRGVQTPVISICCGSGYNGGDGLAAARHLHEWGCAVRVILTGAVTRLREEPATYAAILQRLGVPLRTMTSRRMAGIRSWIKTSDVLVDALLGIGARGDVREPMAPLMHLMNASGKPILAVDVPSGLDADTGAIQGCAIRAQATITFGLPKQGCLTVAGRALTGRLMTDAITIPQRVLQEAR